jgi:hypothetical protein
MIIYCISRRLLLVMYGYDHEVSISMYYNRISSRVASTCVRSMENLEEHLENVCIIFAIAYTLSLVRV